MPTIKQPIPIAQLRVNPIKQAFRVPDEGSNEGSGAFRPTMVVIEGVLFIPHICNQWFGTKLPCYGNSWTWRTQRLSADALSLTC